MIEDVLILLLRIIESDESIRIQDLPNKYTKARLPELKVTPDNTTKD